MKLDKRIIDGGIVGVIKESIIVHYKDENNVKHVLYINANEIEECKEFYHLKNDDKIVSVIRKNNVDYILKSV